MKEFEVTLHTLARVSGTIIVEAEDEDEAIDTAIIECSEMDFDVDEITDEVIADEVEEIE